MVELKTSEQYQEKKENANHQKLIEDMECKCCPVFNTFNIIGKKFSLLILRNMLYDKQKRFNEFLNSIEEINPKTLSIRLKEMEKDGLISSENGFKIKYKNKELYINGTRQPQSVNDKYRKYFKEEDFEIEIGKE